ncbi:MAG: aldose 1-epimerase family protein [Actinomycetota bacterium]|nr:aldose 1-epimerase family protein [Actinomycetota bacterium]MDQ6947563.1 aldose 1-epimerase family protein [Actinomycetota bacterium]
MKPSGRQTVLVHGDQVAVVVEVGGGLRTYRVGGRQILDGYGPDELCASGRGQPLIPWPNRLAGGHYTFEGQPYQASIDEVTAGNAIHGVTRWQSWDVSQTGEAEAVMSLELRPTPGYPFSLHVVIRYTLDDAGLTVTTTAGNHGTGACPWALGFHPYLAAFGGLVDDLELQAPGRVRYLADARGIPTGRDPVGGAWDFRAGRTIGGLHLDTGFSDLDRDDTGRATVTLRRPGHGGEVVRLWMDEAFTHLMIFTGDTVSDPARRRRGLAVEPMTAAPDAFNSGDGLVVLQPGETTQAVWGIICG